jgi:thiamine biosynthesis lipoprotein ApbE
VLQVDHHMTNVLLIAEKLFHETEGRFDITAAPLIQWWRKRASREEFGSVGIHQGLPPQEVMERVGLNHLQIHFPEDPSCLGNSCCASVQKTVEGITVDFSGIGPGYAVDQIGKLLLSLGSTAHLVELGGEVRAWGQPDPSTAWHVRLRLNDLQPQPVISLQDGQAVAIAALQLGKLVVHPQTGRAVTLPHDFNPSVIFATTCAEADALATARILEDFEDIESTKLSP